jgi:hypothetical protein
MGVAVGFMGYHGMVWGSMGITRNVMEKLGFLPFYGIAAKTNLNESNRLHSDVKVTCHGVLLASQGVNQEFP